MKYRRRCLELFQNNKEIFKSWICTRRKLMSIAKQLFVKGIMSAKMYKTFILNGVNADDIDLYPDYFAFMIYKNYQQQILDSNKKHQKHIAMFFINQFEHDNARVFKKSIEILSESIVINVARKHFH